MAPIFSELDRKLDAVIKIARKFDASYVTSLEKSVQSYLPRERPFPMVTTGHVDQVISDVRHLNLIGRTSDGNVPLRAWLANAIELMEAEEWSIEFVEELKEVRDATLEKYGTRKPQTWAFTQQRHPAILDERHPSAPSADNRGLGLPVVQTLVPNSSDKPIATIPGAPAGLPLPGTPVHVPWQPLLPPRGGVKQDPKHERTPGTSRSGTRYAWVALVALGGAIIAGAMYKGNPDPPVQTASKGLGIFVASARTVSIIWPASPTPVVMDSCDNTPVELGVKFRSDVKGNVIGIRFYKAPGNTGTHTGHLWTASGELLASATFTNETNSGWQQVNFASPVPIAAKTEYVASYHTGRGNYINGQHYFTTSGVDKDNPPLHALDGVYHLKSSDFPDSPAWEGSNYWVDVVLQH